MARNDTSNAVLAQAADWFERLQNEDMSVENIAEWQGWLAADPAHRSAFERCQDLWRRLDQVPAPPLPTRAEIAPGRSHVAVPRWAIAAGIAIVTLLSGIVLVAPLWNRNAAITTLYETAAGQREEATFPDGSRLYLGAKSMAWVRYAADERTVALERGEAFVDVARDTQRPFVVRAGSTAVTVLGTAFNVRRAGECLSVAVTEGRVKVVPNSIAPDGNTRGVQLHAGQMLILERPEAVPRILALDSAAADAWRSGRLEYRGEPLKYVIADVNRYLENEVVIADPAAAGLLVTGTLFTDSVKAWLSGLDAFLPVYLVKEDDGRLLLYKRN